VSNDAKRGDRTTRNATALAKEIAALGLRCALEARGGLALLLPSPESVAALEAPDTRRAVVALARRFGFTHVAVELPKDRRTSSTPRDATILRD
jgi:sugar phosphate isomerase/epimerase